jgi:cytidine deaminase
MSAEGKDNPAHDEALDPALSDLLDRARTVAAQSYSPYSHFKVGAAIRLDNGEIVTGTNVENVSYGLTICAERAAVVQAIARFGPTIRIAAAAVANLNGEASPPCGGCRQFMAEFILPDAPVAFPLADRNHVMPFCELLPFACDLKLK